MNPFIFFILYILQKVQIKPSIKHSWANVILYKNPILRFVLQAENPLLEAEDETNPGQGGQQDGSLDGYQP
jgi:hypothetical protein